MSDCTERPQSAHDDDLAGEGQESMPKAGTV